MGVRFPWLTTQNIIKMIPNITIPINDKKVRSNVETLASKVRCEVSDILKNKIICLKVDIASIGPRFFLGINCQYVDGGHACLKNLAVTEIFRRHTSNHLKDLLLLTKISYWYSGNILHNELTIDNSANMLKITNFLSTKKSQKEQLTVGNFYLEWMLCLYKLKNINTETFTILFNKMKQRNGLVWKYNWGGPEQTPINPFIA